MSNPNNPTTKSILIVEDNAGTSRLLQMMLKKEGFAAETAHSVVKAKSAVSANTLALIIDCTLGNDSGIDLLGDIRAGKTAVAPQVLVVMVSGNEKFKLESEALDAKFLLKPYPLVELSSYLKQFLAVAEENNQ